MAESVARFFDACAGGDVAALRGLLAHDPDLVRAANSAAPHGGWTGLHESAKRGHEEAVRLLLDRGADVNAREAGDNTTPLHWAAAGGHVETARALLDAGADVHGRGDLHELDVIGWAAPPVVPLLLERGAGHNIFSAIAAGDADLVRTMVESNPELLQRRTSVFDGRRTPLAFARSRKRFEIAELLAPAAPFDAARMAQLAASVRKCAPMIFVPDVARALQWYLGIGFRELARYADDGLVNFGMVAFGGAELMLNMHGKPGPHDVTLWFYTDQVDALYDILRSRRDIEFEQELEDMFYGVRQFGIRDLNGYVLYFEQELSPAPNA